MCHILWHLDELLKMSDPRERGHPDGDRDDLSAEPWRDDLDGHPGVRARGVTLETCSVDVRSGLAEPVGVAPCGVPEEPPESVTRERLRDRR